MEKIKKSSLLLLIYLFLIQNICAQGFLPKSFEAEIEQVSTGVISKKEKRSQGQLFYEYPGKLRLEILSPEKIVLVVGLEKTWYYVSPFTEDDEGELTITPTKNTLVLSLLDSLIQGLESNALYTVSKKDDLSYEFILNEKSSKDFGAKKFTLKFAKTSAFKDLVEIFIEKNDKTSLRLKFLKMKLDPSFKKDFFHFNAPPKTRISQ